MKIAAIGSFRRGVRGAAALIGRGITRALQAAAPDINDVFVAAGLAGIGAALGFGVSPWLGIGIPSVVVLAIGIWGAK